MHVSFFYKIWASMVFVEVIGIFGIDFSGSQAEKMLKKADYLLPELQFRSNAVSFRGVFPHALFMP